MRAYNFSCRGFAMSQETEGWYLTRPLAKQEYGPFKGDRRDAMAQIDRLVEEWVNAPKEEENDDVE